MPDTSFTKDPAAVLDYCFDWKAETNGTGESDWLASGETISSHSVTVESGLTKDSDAATDTNTSVTVWLSGGTDGDDYTVTCQITTSAGRTDERSVTIKVRNR